MKLTCMVCRELLVPSDDINVAPCGHYLHYTCWIEWLERSKNCPQCRAKTTSRQLVRLFLNVAENEGGEEEDVATLNNKIDSLTFELRCKNKDIENSKELIVKTKNQNTGLKEEIIKYRDDADEAKIQCATLQEKIRYLQRQNKEVQETKRECERLRTQNERLNNLDAVVRGSTSEVKNIVETTPCTPEGLRNLALFCGSLKTCLEETKAKKKKVQDMYDALKSEVLILKEEIHIVKGELENAKSSNRGLSDEIRHLEDEKSSLNKKLRELEAAVLSPSVGSVTNKALKRLIAESPAPALKRPAEGLDDSIVFDLDESPLVTVPGASYSQPSTSKPLVKPQSKTQELDVSPIFGFKPKVVKEGMVKRPLSNSNVSIFGSRLTSTKNPQVKNTSVYSEGYDGLGGHSKADEFPTPTNAKKFKRSQSFTTTFTTGKKKLCAPTNVPKITQFDGFLDLT